MKARQGREVHPSAGHLPELVAVRDLLAHGSFEEAARCLHEMERMSAPLDGLMSATLAAAERVVLARGAVQAETEWHAKVHEEEVRRADALGNQLGELLDLATARLEALRGNATARRDAHAARVWQRVEMVMRRPSAGGGDAEVFEPRRAPVQVRDPSPGRVAVAEPRADVAMPQAIAVHCLGAFRVLVGLEPVDAWNGHKSLSVFKYLLLHRRVPVPKDVLAEVFWPDAEPEAARRNLHQAVYSLRQTLRRARPDLQPILFENECYHVPAVGDLWLDCEQFEQRAHSGQHAHAAGRVDDAIAAFGAADALYQGNLLEEDVGEEWCRLERERLRDLYFEVAHWLVTRHIELGQLAAAVALSQKLLARDACHEAAYRWLMSCYVQQGQRHLAIRQFQSCVDVLRRELDIGPSDETVTLYQRIVGDMGLSVPSARSIFALLLS